MKKIVFLLLAVSVLAATGCKKTGPQGPPGINGNANVVGEDAFTVYNWTLNNNTNIYSATFSDPNITPDIVDRGIVQIYKSYGNNEWTPLPDINGTTSTVFNFYDNGFDIYVQDVDGLIPVYPGTQIFRAVVISASLKQAHPNTDWTDYKATMAAVNQGTVTTAPGAAQ